jgi:hypothetical protein
MPPIEGISKIRRLPRLGKIRLGIKKEGPTSTYPQAVDYFVCPDEVKAVYPDQPKALDIMFPSDNLELIAPQYLKCYSYTQGLICRGDGRTCVRKVDIETGDYANKETKQWELSNGTCVPDSCPMMPRKQCRRVMSLLFMLPEVPGLGVYQIDTSSFYSIVNINSQLAPDGYLRNFTPGGRIAFIPLVLSIGPQVVEPPGAGRKTVHVLSIKANVKLSELIRISRQPAARVLLPTLAEEEPPDDLFPEGVLKEGEGTPVPESPEAAAEWEKLKGHGETEPEKTPAPGGQTGAVTSQPAASANPPASSGSPPGVVATPPTAESPPGQIDMKWVTTTLSGIKWSDITAKSWIAVTFKIETTGSLQDLLYKLNIEQRGKFCKHIQNLLDQKQANLFNET